MKCYVKKRRITLKRIARKELLWIVRWALSVLAWNKISTFCQFYDLVEVFDGLVPSLVAVVRNNNAFAHLSNDQAIHEQKHAPIKIEHLCHQAAPLHILQNIVKSVLHKNAVVYFV